jgi:hypothetical protein
MIVIPQSAEITIQNAIKAILDGAIIKLYKNDLTPHPATVVGDFVECDFSGYTAYTVVAWGATFLNSDGKAEGDAPSHMFARAAGATSNDVFGYYCTTAAGALLFAERFTGAPIPMNTPVSDAIVLLSRFTFGSEF